MTISKNKLFILAVLLPLCILLSMTTKPLLTSLQGEEIIIKTIPYDPRDLFYGDYVTLEFEIENVSYKLADKELQKALDEYDEYEFEALQDIYIHLKKNKTTGIAEASSVSLTKPKRGLYLQATFNYIESTSETLGSPSKEELNNRIIHLQLPFDRFYLEEGTGKQLEEDARKGNLFATIKVRNGYAILEKVER